MAARSGLRHGGGSCSGSARDRAWGGLLAAVLVSVLGLAAPIAASAADGLTDIAATTYTLNPAEGRLDVAIEITVSNAKANTTVDVPCTKWVHDPAGGYHAVPGTCPQTTTYYVNETFLWIERTATRIAVTADRGAVSISVGKRDTSFDEYRVGFTNVYNGGTLHLRVTYQVPGGAPRSAEPTRVGKAYASFCVIANGIDGGSTRVVAPTTYAMQVDPHNGAFTTTTSGGARTWQTLLMPDASAFWACFTGDDPVGYLRSTLASPAGRAIELQAWPEDPVWNATAKREISDAVGKLEKLVGRALPGTGPIIVREVGSDELGAYAGTFTPSEMVARVGENLDQPGVVAHELSHSWFNDALFTARWLSEGSADWAESTITGEPCREPGTFPGPGSPNIADWRFAGPRATRRDLEVIDYQYAASCFVVSTLAGKAGPDRMRTVLAALIDHEAAYRSGGVILRHPDGPEDWRAWLDAIDELGLVPAGVTDLDYAQNLVARFDGEAGIAMLPARSKARTLYHRLAGEIGAWAIPEAVLRPMNDWRFDEATAAIQTESAAFAAVSGAAEALPEAGAVNGPIRRLVEGAPNLAALSSAAAKASDQRIAAEAVAEAKGAATAPRDPLEQVGLIGTDLDPWLAAGVAAVASIDLATARARADQVNAALAAAPGLGAIRLGAALGLVLFVGLGFLLVRRRRAAARARAVAALAAVASIDGADGTAE
jgi:hypothetical protein